MDSLTKEVINYLQDVQSQLVKDLISLKEKIEETKTSLLESSSLGLIKKMHLEKISNGMKKRISKQREEILQYERAELELNGKNPQDAIKILTKLTDDTFSVWDIVIDRDNFAIPVHGTPNPPERIQQLKEFIKKFYDSQHNELLE